MLIVGVIFEIEPKEIAPIYYRCEIFKSVEIAILETEFH